MSRTSITTRAFLLLSLVAAAANAAERPPLEFAATVPVPATGMGFSPPPLPTAHLAPVAAAKADLPARWDWREAGIVSPVKNQGACGSCYAFGAAGEFESLLMQRGEAGVDVSENSIKECNWQASSCGGGNQYMVYNYLTRSGSVAELCDPYQPADVACTLGCARTFVPLSWHAIAGSTLPVVADLKQVIHTEGPIHSTLYTGGDGGNPAWQQTFNDYDGDGCLYLPGDYDPDHSIVIVGWDDTIPHAGGTGAWIVKNSWGTNWGGICGYGTERGYFYIAYGSAGIGKWSSRAAEVMEYDPDQEVRSYDEAGLTQYMGAGSTVLWGLARFTTGVATYLHRVEFWTTDATAGLEVDVYDDLIGGVTSNLLASRGGIDLSSAGYHSVALDPPLALDAGQTVYAAVKFANVSYTLPLPVDVQGPTETGTTYFSLDGYAWGDMAGYGADVAIRIRTSPHDVLHVYDDDNAPDNDGAPPAALVLSPAVPNPFNPRTTLTFEMPQGGAVNLAVYDLTGRRIRTLRSATLPAGRYTASWDGRDEGGRAVAAGVYLAHLIAENTVRSTKLILLR